MRPVDGSIAFPASGLAKSMKSIANNIRDVMLFAETLQRD
jgi:hypothetical protein